MFQNPTSRGHVISNGALPVRRRRLRRTAALFAVVALTGAACEYTIVQEGMEPTPAAPDQQQPSVEVQTPTSEPPTAKTGTEATASSTPEEMLVVETDEAASPLPATGSTPEAEQTSAGETDQAASQVPVGQQAPAVETDPTSEQDQEGRRTPATEAESAPDRESTVETVPATQRTTTTQRKRVPETVPTTQPTTTTERIAATQPEPAAETDSAANQQPVAETGDDANLKIAEAESLKLLNELRAEKGLPKLKLRSDLAAFARSWSETMANDGFGHSTAEARGDLLDGRSGAGENIAANFGTRTSPKKAIALAHQFHDMWMRSPGHYRNMVNRSYDEVGIGFFRHPEEGWFATVFFARS